MAAWSLGFAAPATADESNATLLATVDGRELPLPLLRSHFEVGIRGDLATVVLTQVFENPYTVPIHARYIFPLPSQAAVFAMRLQSGDEMIEAEIRTKPEARETYERAKRGGRGAALLNQERPDVFTQEVANLLPGAPVHVELEYSHAVEKRDGAYHLHIPTLVGPRYLPAPPSTEDPHDPGTEAAAGAPTRRAGEPEGVAIGRWTLPATPPLAPPDRVDSERVAIDIDLDAGMPIRALESPTHDLRIDAVDDARRFITLAEGRTLDNRDFELRYALAGEEVAAGLTTFAEEGEGFLSLLIEPPLYASDAAITARELVFVLDCSGSMSGTPISASKRFMKRSLDGMRQNDSFRIIRFSDSATEWSVEPMPATAENLRRAHRYVDELYGSGGTHMASGIRAAFDPPVPAGSLRIVVFLTDGYIGNDIEIVRLLESRRGEARLFSFGIGNNVNRYLVEEMGRVGRGAARIVRPGEDADLAADEWVERLAAPVLTDVWLDWGDADIFEVFPSDVPDLFLGQTLRVLGRYRSDSPDPSKKPTRVTVHGKVAGQPVSLPLEVTLPFDDESEVGEALPIVWARAQIEDRMIEYLRPNLSAEERDALQREVTGLGLEHRLMTQWTSFVAVAKRVVNPGGQGFDADVAVPRGKGLPDSAYPPGALPPASPAQGALKVASHTPGLGTGAFNVHTGPEPSTWLAWMTLGGLALLWFRRSPGAH